MIGISTKADKGGFKLPGSLSANDLTASLAVRRSSDCTFASIQHCFLAGQEHGRAIPLATGCCETSVQRSKCSVLSLGALASFERWQGRSTAEPSH
jgi:hypothetical protein